MSALTVALAGNPNTGKTTIFNALTGARQHIGNWPGVTVEKVVGQVKKGDKLITVIDLPGTYSLSAYSLEEKIVADYISGEKPDILVNVVDASNLERNLYLTIQLLELGAPLIISLNMVDEAQRKGLAIDPEALSRHLGVPVVTTIATRKVGLDRLIEKFIESNETPNQISDMVAAQLAVIKKLSNAGKEDELIEARYNLIGQLVNTIVKTSGEPGKSLSDKLDKVLTNRILGIPIFLGIMFLMFETTFTWVGQPLTDGLGGWVDGWLVEWAAGVLTGLGVASWLESLIVDGIIAGVGGVLIFIPLIFTLFLIISFLDGTGYMARVAFIMDRVMRKIGLSGKVFLPLMVGFGCSVPAVMGTRVVDSERDRRVAVLISPLMSCSARLPVYALFAAIFFVGSESLVVMSLYLLGVIIAILTGIVLKATILKGEPEPFIMELPPYRLPTPQVLLMQTWEKGKGFLIRAGTIIFSMSVLIWFLSNYNLKGTAEIENSLLASLGGVIAPIFTFHGFAGWEAGVAILTGIMAKEVVVATLGIIYSVGALSEETTLVAAQMQGVISTHFTALSAYAFLVFTLLYTPCIAALGIIKKELNSWKWTFFAAGYMFALAWVVSLVIYQGGRLLGLGV